MVQRRFPPFMNFVNRVERDDNNEGLDENTGSTKFSKNGRFGVNNTLLNR